MGKNSQIHLFIETELKERLEKEAEENCISLSELCRQRVRVNDRLKRVENVLDILLAKITKISQDQAFLLKSSG